MYVNDYNLFLLTFHCLLLLTLTALTNSLGMLLLAELIWISLFLLATSGGIYNDDSSLAALPFFFLVFSAVELGFGLILLTLQLQLTRSLNMSLNTPTQISREAQNEPFFNAKPRL